MDSSSLPKIDAEIHHIAKQVATEAMTVGINVVEGIHGKDLPEKHRHIAAVAGAYATAYAAHVIAKALGGAR